MSLPDTGTQETPVREPHQKFKGHTDSIWGVIDLPCRQRIITCSRDGSLRLWNLKNGLQIGKDWRDGETSVNAIALSPDRQTVASGSGDGAVRLWSIETGKVVAKWTGHSGIVWSICWARDGKRVVSGSADSTAKVWDVASGKTIGQINTGQTTGSVIMYAVAYSPNHTMIATGCDDVELQVWDAKTFELVITLKHDHVLCLAWTTDGKTLISGGNDVRIWNTATWKQSATLMEHTDVINPISAIAISPNDCILASASYDKTARLWNLENGQPIGSPIQRTTGVLSISFLLGGRLLVTGDENGGVCTWDLAAIIKEADFNEFWSDSNVIQNPVRKTALASATQRLPNVPNSTRRLPNGFFDDTGDHIHSSSNRSPPLSSARQSSALRPRVFLDRISLLFRRPDPAVRNTTSHNAQTQYHSLVHLSRQHRPDSEQYPHEVEVPYTQGRPRNVNATAGPKGKASVPSNIMTIAVPGPSRPQIGGVAQQSSGDAFGQTLSQPQLAANTTPAATATAGAIPAIATSLYSEPVSDTDIVIRQAGCWTRFWLFLGCISAENHH